ncbi:MAG: cofactor-independent phosphoglycerate mutase [Candidatus Omnitrophota bacterium]|nr:cofactor-independent phosphoglycerate mutase [Candidatus Omnitrophota bacterium]
MKYIVLVGDGMGDRSIEDLGGKTVLEVAKIPNMNFIAEHGKVGLTNMVPGRMPPASDVANLSILGYNPKKYYTGRGPLEAANMGIDLKDNEVAFRCNLVTISDERMADYSAGHISNEEARHIIEELNSKLGTEDIKFYPGISYRHIVVFKCKDKEEQEGFINAKCLPPHDIAGKKIDRFFPSRTPQAEVLKRLMDESRKILADHEVNRVRLDLKENPANMIWLWGQGVKPFMPKFSKLYHVEGSIISAVDLIKGIGRIIGLDVIDVPGATGYYDTNYLGKAEYAIESLKKKDFVFVHVEAPDEAGHNGDLREKIYSIEKFDKFVVGTILSHFKSSKEESRILVLYDHATPVAMKTHVRDRVCFAMYGTDIEHGDIKHFNEKEARLSKFRIDKGHELMEFFIR